MKVRQGFVSNSSSASFVIPLKELTGEQINALLVLDKTPVGPWSDFWEISIRDDELHGFTIMDNGCEEGMQAELVKLGLDLDNVNWEDWG